MDTSENDFTLSQPRKRKISYEEFKAAEESLINWRIAAVVGSAIVAILSCVFCYGLFMHEPEKLCTLGPMLVLIVLIYWTHKRSDYYAKLCQDYEAQQ